MSLAVVTVLHDSEAHLRRLLASVATHLAPAPEIVAVDSGSRDAGARVARAAGARVVSLPDNPGYGAANNAGVLAAQADVVALLNPDVVLRDDGLLRLAAAARGHDALHAPRLLEPDGSVQGSAHPLPGSGAAFARALLPGPLRRRAGERAAGWAIGAALVARRATLLDLGPFDERAFLFYEDLDLCLRARAAGVPLVRHPGVALTHVGGHSTGTEDVALQVRRRREVVTARLGAAAWRRDRAALLLEHGLRAGRPRDRAWVRALRAA